MNLLRRGGERAAVLCALLVLSAPAGARDALFGVASDGTSAVAVGDSGRVLYAPLAPHNTVWNGASTTTVNPLRAVRVTPENYVAVGDNGTLYRSSNLVGNVWIPRSSRTSHDLLGVTTIPAAVIAVGDSGTVIRSANISTDDWSVVVVPTSKKLWAVAGGGLRTVAVGDSGTVIWAATSTPGAWFQASAVPTTDDLLGVAEGPGNPSTRFWAVGRNGALIRSLPNAEQWDPLDSTVGVDLHAIAFLPPLYTVGVAVGDDGTILYSNGGATWTSVDSHTTVDLYGVGYTGSGTGGGFVAVGDSNVILWSGDGITWVDVIVATKSQSWGSIRGSWGTQRP